MTSFVLPFHLTYFICIGWNICQNLHKLVNQRSLGVLAGTLINKLTLTSQQKVVGAGWVDMGPSGSGRISIETS